MRSVVVLPQPEGPKMERNSPPPHLEVEVVQNGFAAEDLLQPSHDELVIRHVNPPLKPAPP